LLFVVPSHDRRADGVWCVAVVADEGDSLPPQPELVAGVKSIVVHQLLVDVDRNLRSRSGRVVTVS
jgi:hypothetical protein